MYMQIICSSIKDAVLQPFRESEKRLRTRLAVGDVCNLSIYNVSIIQIGFMDHRISTLNVGGSCHRFFSFFTNLMFFLLTNAGYDISLTMRKLHPS